MMGWQEYCLEMRQQHPELTWRQLGELTKRAFPNDFKDEAMDKVRSYIRRKVKSEQQSIEQPDTTVKLSGLDNSMAESAKVIRPSMEYKADGSVTSDKLIELCEGVDITPEVIIKAHGFDPQKWQVVSCKNNWWHAKDSDQGRIIMYQSKLVVKPLANGLAMDEIDRHFAEMDRLYKAPMIVPDLKTGRPCMAEVNIADLHLGKLCHRGNTGNNYDSNIAHSMFNDIVNRIAQEIMGKNVEKVMFVWSNDFFNSDTIDRKTTAGTQQDTDSRFEKLFNVGVEMLVDAISVFAKIAPVETFYLASNHDKMAAYYAVKYLQAWFKNDPRVHVDINAMGRKYRDYGATLIGFCHGCDINPKKLSGLMPIEARELWGKAKYCEMHTAHLHSEHAIEEINGIIVRRISSPTANDTWHVESGYIGQVRKAQTFIYDFEMGLVNIINTPVA